MLNEAAFSKHKDVYWMDMSLSLEIPKKSFIS